MDLSTGMFGSRCGNLFFLDSFTPPLQRFRPLQKVSCTELSCLLLVLFPVECSFLQEANLYVCELRVVPVEQLDPGEETSGDKEDSS